MIDSENVTRYDLTRRGREEQILFWLLVSGKTADVVAPALARILAAARRATGCGPATRPFTVLRAYLATGRRLRPLLKRHGIGCHGMKSRGIHDLLAADLDLATCPPEALLAVTGIRHKTCNCFLLHTRREYDHLAGLDTHMLAELRERRKPGWRRVPASSPTNPTVYAYWTGKVRELAAEAGMSMPAFDLSVFRRRHRAVGRRRRAAPAAA